MELHTYWQHAASEAHRIVARALVNFSLCGGHALALSIACAALQWPGKSAASGPGPCALVAAGTAGAVSAGLGLLLDARLNWLRAGGPRTAAAIVLQAGGIDVAFVSAWLLLGSLLAGPAAAALQGLAAIVDVAMPLLLGTSPCGASANASRMLMRCPLTPLS